MPGVAGRAESSVLPAWAPGWAPAFCCHKLCCRAVPSSPLGHLCGFLGIEAETWSVTGSLPEARADLTLPFDVLPLLLPCTRTAGSLSTSLRQA